MKRELTEKETFSRLKKNIRVCSIACPVSTVCMGALALVNVYTLFSDNMPVLFWSLFSVVFVAIIVFFRGVFPASCGCVVWLLRWSTTKRKNSGEVCSASCKML